MILLIDNYDSFTHNLFDYINQLNGNCVVRRNDEISLKEIKDLNPAGIVLSPGPGRPADAGILMEVIAHFSNSIPILGICLGHQAIGEHFGASLVKAEQPMHGKTSMISVANHFIFNEMPSEIEVMRYHSLVLENLPNCLEEIAQTNNGVNMAIAHKELNIIGIQFHPESILTERGLGVMKNWMESLVVRS